jgi:flavin-dependent dehydrogenase
MKPWAADVCVLGAGPAGTIFATRMAQMGHGVVLSGHPPRRADPVIESVGTDVSSLLAAAGMDDCLSSSATAAPALSISWGREAWREDFPSSTFMVDRAAFDAALLRGAQRCGVRVLQPDGPVAALRSGDRWRLVCRSEGHALVESGLLVYATGRRRAPGRTEAIGTNLLAISGRWRGSAALTFARIEAFVDGWIWGVPMRDGTCASIAFVDPWDFGRRPGTLKSRFEELLRASALVGPDAAVAFESPVRAFDATAYLARRPVTATSLMVGDAALALDPISSGGVRSAVQTSLAASVTVNTMLRRSGDCTLARDFYRDQLRRGAESHARWVNSHYAEAAKHFGTPFWQKRALAVPRAHESDVPLYEMSGIAERPIQLSRAAEFVTHPSVQGDFVVPLEAFKLPGFDTPIAYFGGEHLAPLLRAVEPGSTPLQLARSWSEKMSLRTAIATATWLVGKGVLVPQEHVSS